MKIYKKAILPKGFLANGVACGIKKSGRLDLALLYSAVPAKAACRFTSNKIPAAPILLDKVYLKRSKGFQAIIANSGNANAFTGEPGLKDAEEVVRSLAKALKAKKESILVNSTGIIARRLEVNKIKKAVPGLVAGLSAQGIHKAKKAILTTDTFSKEVTAQFNLGRKTVSICGIAKGAGMIAPDMATMLCFILTDANIAQSALNKALAAAVDNSFNCITVDGCMSTNDSAMLLSNGASGCAVINSGKSFDLFLRALDQVCLSLAKMIVRDAEGASKFIQIRVEKAKNKAEAERIALAIANSNLFKTAAYGENPNFGRIIAAVGASGVEVREKDLSIKVSSLKKKEIIVRVSVKQGSFSATVYTSDLTPEYIKINAQYN